MDTLSNVLSGICDYIVMAVISLPGWNNSFGEFQFELKCMSFDGNGICGRDDII